jgi:hypothetical protein
LKIKGIDRVAMVRVLTKLERSPDTSPALHAALEKRIQRIRQL